MRLDRNTEGNNGRGKYALVRLRDVKEGSEAHSLLRRLYDLDCVDMGIEGNPDEFFVIKLRDKYARYALTAYAEAVTRDSVDGTDKKRRPSLSEYAVEVYALADRAGPNNPYCKVPD